MGAGLSFALSDVLVGSGTTGCYHKWLSSLCHHLCLPAPQSCILLRPHTLPQPCRLRQRIEQVWSVISVHAPPDSGAARGFSLLTEFLGRVWWLDGSGSGGSSSGASAGLPQQQQQQQALYLQDLEVGLHQSSVFDPLVQFARLAASWEMRCNEERYSPFLAGCGYEGMSVAQVGEGMACGYSVCGAASLGAGMPHGHALYQGCC